MVSDKNLAFLLRWLLDEGGYNNPIPNSREDQWQMFRALVNVRLPKPASEKFLAAQDEFLQAMIAGKGITDIADLRPVRDNLYLWRGDITTLRVDAIVNAANSQMLGCFAPPHKCIDNAIHTSAGVQLRLACDVIMKQQSHPEPTGQAKITAAYNLPSKYVLHTVGPIVQGQVTDEDRRLLASCYHSCLALAEQHQIESVAFCCVSTGLFCFPNREAAEIAVDTVSGWLNSSRYVKKVVFNVFTEKDQQIYEALLG